MDKAQFWRLIEDAKAKSGGDCEEQAELLKGALVKLPPEEIIAFGGIMDELLDQAYRWDLWGAGELINGFCSDDGFFYFRGWLVAQGRTVYENALANPDSLADVVEPDSDDAECEALLYVAGRAYKATMGKETPDPDDFVDNPSGEYVAPEPSGPKPNEINAQTFYPRLWAWAEAQNTEA